MTSELISYYSGPKVTRHDVVTPRTTSVVMTAVRLSDAMTLLSRADGFQSRVEILSGLVPCLEQISARFGTKALFGIPS
jgi:hypothetical protein